MMRATLVALIWSYRRRLALRLLAWAAAQGFFLARLGLRHWLAARLTADAPTGAVGAELAEALPSSLVATTVARSRRPMSSVVGAYVRAVAPSMSSQSSVSRCHW